MLNVTATEFQRKFGVYQDKALKEPVSIQKGGRERLVLLSFDEYQKLKSRSRTVIAAEEMNDALLTAIEAAKR